MKKAMALTFHGLKASSRKVEGVSNLAAKRYKISEKTFSEMISNFESAFSATTSDFYNKTSGCWQIMTFDDGLATDYEVAYPILESHGLKATFFITVENIGKSGYANIEQLREMKKFGMEIASHGLTHQYLVTMPKDNALGEIRDSKDRLQQEINAEVTSFAPVGGHYHRWMLKAVEDSGYTTFATMIPGLTKLQNGFVVLKRNHIMKHHSIRYAESLIQGKQRILILNYLRYFLLFFPKFLFGMNNYDTIKNLILRYRSH